MERAVVLRATSRGHHESASLLGDEDSVDGVDDAVGGGEVGLQGGGWGRIITQGQCAQ